MPEYLAPGVFVEEVSSGNKPIEGVGTSTASFIGRARKGPVDEPTLITNFSQFQSMFGDFHPDYALAYAVQQFFFQGGKRCYVIRTYKETVTTAASGNNPAVTDEGVAGTTLDSTLEVSASSPGTWGNQMKVQITKPSFAPDNDQTKHFMLRLYQGEDPIATFDQLSLTKTGPDGMPNPNYVEDVINDANPYISVAISSSSPPASASSPPTLAGFDKTAASSPIVDLEDGDDGDTPEAVDYGATGSLKALDKIDQVNMITIPELAFLQDGGRDEVVGAIGYATKRADCVYIADPPPHLSPTEVLEFKQATGKFSSGNAFNSSYATLYYPWILITDPLTGKRKPFPPSAAAAGTYANTDVKRGVHKAPAGTLDGYLNVAVGIERDVTKGEQEVLNPEGVNVIRKFPDAGIVIWGARTVSSDPEWRYVNVRRLFLFLEQSIDKGTQSYVFEPNDRVLWAQIIANVSAFLKVQWQAGMLVGAKPEEAYFVKCDEETNPPESVDLGRVVTVIGVAPSKPAEFVIFRISQWRPTS